MGFTHPTSPSLNPKSEGYIKPEVLFEWNKRIQKEDEGLAFLAWYLKIDKSLIEDWELTKVPWCWGLFITKLKLRRVHNANDS